MHNYSYRLIRKILFLFPPEAAHKLALNGLFYLEKFGLLKLLFKNKNINKNADFLNLSFSNKLGLAAGLDKNAEYLEPLSKLGFSFIEVGTVTPIAQIGNEKPRLFRLEKQEAIINRMGFNNLGIDNLIKNILNFKNNSNIILGINIGKNAKTPIKNAVDDYIICMEKAYNHCHYISINISSPNTVGLRDLQHPKYFNALLMALKNKQSDLAIQYNKYTPIAIKISPDLSYEQIMDLCLLIIKYKIDIIIATNTTIEDRLLYDQKNSKIQGGLSGRPLFTKANKVLEQINTILVAQNAREDILIIGVGGINSKEDAATKINIGADLVQIYSGLIYQGPNLIKNIINYI